ncbi:MAG: ATP synthase F1 subunit gamma [Candidatus Eisenbacteria bacterium]|nr:ATP synthase F1 subunit gamma [Candidatus Eisenbacteria bacterium]
MAKMREIGRRIRSLQKTKQITKTMELVATSRMRKTQRRALAARPYGKKLEEILRAAGPGAREEEFLLLRVPETRRRVGLLVVTSNRGLCGAFNANVLRLARRSIEGLRLEGIDVEIHTVGRKGANALRYRGYAIASSRSDIGDRPTMAQASEIAGLFIDEFLRGTIDELRVVYASFASLSSQPPVTEVVLPFPALEEERARRPDFLLEPTARTILGNLLPRIVEHKIFRALLENAAGEQAARRIAMKNATDNAEELIRLLTRSYNRARQAQITQEIAEIVGGASALV